MAGDELKILIVDDSRIFRSVIDKVLENVEGFHVIGSVWNGLKALEFIQQNPPDLVTLDVEMPEMDGIETLRRIQEFNHSHPDRPPIGVVMVSSHTRKGAEITIRALEEGAFDFISKPEGAGPEVSLGLLREELVPKLRAFMAGRSRVVAPVARAQVLKIPRVELPSQPLPKPPEGRCEALLIGISTGGPKALSVVLPEISSRIGQPILIVQHMPPLFTKSLAETLDKRCAHTVVEAKEGDEVKPGHVYIAPGGYHMILRKAGDKVEVGLNQQPPENGCRPSVDVMFRSAAQVFGGRLLALVMTGMGNDGAKSLGAIKRAGGRVIAQDEASSVVWGMPGSAVATGQVDGIYSLDGLPEAIKAFMK